MSLVSPKLINYVEIVKKKKCYARKQKESERETIYNKTSEWFVSKKKEAW